MSTTLFTSGWTFFRDGNPRGIAVRLPHDAMISETRSEDGGTGNHGGFFPGGSYLYSKNWTPPQDAEERDYSLMFEGVYGRTVVTVDGVEVGQRGVCLNSGYDFFEILCFCCRKLFLRSFMLFD